MTYHTLYLAAANAGDLDGRAAYAVTKYARYILGGGSQDATLITWAKSAIRNALGYAAMMRMAVVADAGYANAQTDDDTSDTNLQTIVETLINTQFKNVVL